MADSYPFISEKNWWTIRERFKEKIPSVVSDSYIMSLLQLSSENSARSNVVSPMKRIGLLDQDNKPTELVKEWRLDENYREACNTIIQKVYPEEFLALFSGNEVDYNSINSWFMRLGVGKDAARKMANFYLLLKSGEIGETKKSSVKTNNTGKNVKGEKKDSVKNKKENTSIPSDSGTSGILESKDRLIQPKLHIDLQIHISPDSTPEQIECIFSSMAKHLYGVLD